MLVMNSSNFNKKYKIFIIQIVFAIFVVSPTISFSIEQQIKPTYETVNLQLKWLHQFQFAGYYAAKEKGFYADEGLDVQIHKRTLDINVVDQVISGRADYGIGDSGILADYANGKAIKVLAVIFQHDPLVFISKQSSAIVSPYEMVGKRIMFDKTGRDSAPLIAMLHDAGLTDDSFSFIKPTMNSNALINNETDVMYAYVSDQPYQYKKKGIDINIINPQNYGFDFYGDLLFTSQAELSAYPGRADKFKRASLKGWQYALEHSEEVINIILDKYNTAADKEALRYEAKVMRKLILPQTIALGNIEVSRLRRVADTYSKLNISKPLTDSEIQGFIHQGIDDLNLSQQELDWLANHPVIRVGIKTDFAPYEWVDKHGVHMGLAADYMSLLEQRLGMKFEYIRGKNWYETVQMAKRGELDLLANMTQLPEHDAYFNFSKSYAVSPVVIVSTEEVGHINSLDVLANKTIVVINACFRVDWLKKHYPEINLIFVNNSREALQQVATGNADGFIADATHASYIIKKTHLFNLHFASTTLDVNRFRIATVKSQPELTSIINKVLASISNQHKKSITDQWLELKEVKGIHFEKLIKYIIALGILFAIFSYWIYRLRQSEKNLIEQDKKMTAIFEASNDAIFLLKDKTIFDCNRRAIKLFRMNSKDEIIGKRVVNLFTKHLTDDQSADFIINKHIKKTLAEGVSHFEWLCRRWNDNYFAAEIQISSYKYNKEQLLLLSVRNITERKEIEQREYQQEQALQTARQKQITINQELAFQKDALDQHLIVSITDVKGKIVYVNNKFSEISGYSKKELLGQNHRIVKSDEHPRELFVDMWRTIANGGIWQGEVKNKAKDGSFYWVHATIVPQLNDQGKPIQYIAMRTDITQLKELQTTSHIESEYALIRAKISHILQGQETLKQRIKQSLSVLVQVDELHLQNKAGIFLIPIGNQDLTMYATHGTFTEEFLTKEQCIKAGDCLCGRVAVSGYLKISDNCFTDHEHEHTFEGMKAHGHYIVPIKFAEEILGVLFIYTDPNPSREPARLSLLTQIAGLFGLAVANDRINKALTQQIDEANKANKAKSEFLSSMSHELRTPLNAILGFGQLLETDDETPLTEIQKESVDYILSSGNHLLALINEILELSAIEAGKVDLSVEPVNLKECVDESLLLIANNATQNNIEIKLLGNNNEIFVLADYIKLKQILLNLMTNAIKYNRSGGSVSIDWQNIGDEKVRLSVSDTGIGISTFNQHKVFREFDRLGKENSAIEGTGIGLLVTKNIVELMDGSIGFNSVENKGSTFWVELPAPVKIENATAENRIMGSHEIDELLWTKNDKGASVLTKKILYVEDNPANRQLIQAFFNKQNDYVLEMAETAEIAYQKLSDQVFDIILMDIHLPKMSGIELAKILKENEQFKQLPIIALTAAAMIHDIDNSSDLFDSYMTKPIDFQLLSDTLKKYLE